MHVRDATFEDCDAIGVGMKVVVDEGCWLATESGTAEGLAERFRQVILEGDPLLVLEEQGGIIGSLGLHSTEAAGVLSLGMWVLPAHRGRGGGRVLMGAAQAGGAEGAPQSATRDSPDNEPPNAPPPQP